MFPEVPSKMSGVAVDDDNAIRRLVYAKERTKSFGDLRIDRSKMTALMQMVSATDSKLLFITSIEGKWYHVDGLGHQHGVYSGQIVNAQRGDAPDDAFIIDKKYLVPVP
jgi:hypothetical protein